MQIRGGAQLRGVLVPVGVAVASILGLTWYGLFWIPAQQRYLNQSNLRLLRTMSAQIKAKVDNFDQAIDHAIDSFSTSSKESTAFKGYVQAFAPDLEILENPTQEQTPVYQKGVEDLVFERAGDPPRVVVRRDEGRNFLYLGYYRPEGHRKVIARGDIEKVVAPFLATRSQFDAVLLANKDGRVIAQKSPSGIELARIDSLVEPPTGPQPEDSKKKVPTAFDKLRTASHIVDVQLGDAPFKLYLQPIQLSLNRAEGTAGSDEPEEWTLCGLVRADHFRADSSAISYTYLLWFSALLALVFLAIPLLKLQLLSPRERLRDDDGVWVAVSTFLGAALLTFCITDGYFFGVVSKNTTDQQLKGLADALKDHLEREVTAIEAQRKVFDDDKVWERLDYKGHGSLRTYYRANPPTIKTKASDRHVRVLEQGCDPDEACKEGLLESLPQTLLPYPFFERVAWYDATGWERIKWTTRERVTPFIDLKEAQLPDYGDLMRGAPHGVDVIQSPTTSETVTVFWRTLAPLQSDRHDRGGSELTGQWLSLATPLSLRQPVLPPGFRFAVVDPDGLVLFHSDPTHSLKQNFFEETEDNPALRAAAQGQYDHLVTGNYEGRRHRFWVTPVDAGLSATTRPWSLIVFQNTSVSETVNLETLTLALVVFAIYSAILASLWAGAYLLWTGYPQKWFWPNRSIDIAYGRIVVINVLLTAASLGWALLFESTTLIIGTVALAFAGLVATFRMLTQNRSQEGTSEGPRWRHSFCLARASLVFILAVAPAFACFRVAYAFETKLLIKSGQANLAHQLDERPGRIAEEAERPKVFTDLRSRLAQDIYTAQFFETCRPGTKETEDQFLSPSKQLLPAHRCDEVAAHQPARDGALDDLLAAIHRSYNDVAVELQAAIPNNQRWSESDGESRTRLLYEENGSQRLTSDLSATTALPGLGYWLALAAAMAVLYVLVQYVAARLFVLHLYDRPGVDDARAVDTAQNVLLIGPPGCGKTAMLQRAKRIRVFDVRTMAFVDRRTNTRPVAVEREQRVGAQAAVSAQGFAWPANDEPQDPQPRRSSRSENWAAAFSSVTFLSKGSEPIGIDHFEYGFDDPAFRDPMLSALEDLIYRQQRVVWIASTRDPWRRVLAQPEQDANGSSLPDRDRWARVLKSFRKEDLRFEEDEAFDKALVLEAARPHVSPALRAAVEAVRTECRPVRQLRMFGEELVLRWSSDQAAPPPPEQVVSQIGDAVEPYYQVLWAGCSRQEQLALRQLAEEGVVNPNNESVLRQLLQDGLIVHQPTFRVMNETFRRFVLQVQSSSTVAEWEREGIVVSWGNIRTTLMTVAVGLAGLLLLTQQQLLEAWVGYIPALAPAIPTAIKVLGSLQRGGKTNASPA